MLGCILALTACGSAEEDADDAKLSPDIETTLIESTQATVDTIVKLSEEDIQSYLDSDEAFAVSAMEAWNGSKKELGQFKSIGDAVVETEKKITTVTVPVEFENESADFIFVCDKKYAPTSMSIDIKYSMATKLERAGLNTVMGIGIVFLMLVFLSFVISLFKYIPKLIEGKGKEKEPVVQKAAPLAAPAPAPVAEEEELVDDGELVAVIAAAIAASENTSTDGFVVRSVRKVNKRNWKRA